MLKRDCGAFSMEKAALAQLLEEKYEEKSMLNRDFSMFGMEKAALAQLLCTSQHISYSVHNF